MLAILFALLLGPGAGHLLLGRTLRGLLWAAAVWAFLLGGFWVTPWLFAVGLALVIANVLDAGLVRARERGVPAWLPALALCLLLVVAQQALRIGIRAYHVETFKIPSGAMLPTIEIGDHVAVRKVSGQARRGEIVVFIYPLDPRKDFIKRVVAVGGDRIELRGRELWLNGKPIPRRELSVACSYAEAEEGSAEGEQRPCVAVEEELEGRRYRVIYNAYQSTDPGRREVLVPADHVFVVGDNRDNSHDSRFWGTVPLANVKGRAEKVIWSSGPQGVRWDRVNLRLR